MELGGRRAGQGPRSPLTCAFLPVPTNSTPMAILRGLPSPHGLHEQAQEQQGTWASTRLTSPGAGSDSALCWGLPPPPLGHTAGGWGTSWLLCPARLAPPRLQEYLEFRKERSQMLLSRRNQLLLEFSFWNEPQPRAGPNIYELRTYKLKVPPPPCSSLLSREPERWGVGPVPQHLDWGFWPQKRCVCTCAYMHAQG